MALTPITISNSTPKQIATSNFSTTSGTILYTVPAGKTCVGVLFGATNQNTQAQAGITINGTQVVITLGVQPTSTGGVSCGPIPVTLIAGTSLSAVGSTGTYVSFIGVEE
jgi:hypothetical protein